MDETRRAEIRARCDAATRAPWKLRHDARYSGKAWWVDGPGPHSDKSPIWSVGGYALEADAAFIAHARQDVPDLLDHIAQRYAEMEKVQRHAYSMRTELKRLGGDVGTPCMVCEDEYMHTPECSILLAEIDKVGESLGSRLDEASARNAMWREAMERVLAAGSLEECHRIARVHLKA